MIISKLRFTFYLRIPRMCGVTQSISSMENGTTKSVCGQGLIYQHGNLEHADLVVKYKKNRGRRKCL